MLQQLSGNRIIMTLTIKPSDLQFKYPRDTVNRDQPKFSGKPDPAPFNRDDLYEIIPMLAAVMDELGSDDGRVLHRLEELVNNELPRSIIRRDEVFDFLVATMGDLLSDR
jgi:hypothetical protein